MVGCTADTDATHNTGATGTGVPIYWLNGAKVADDYADFYDGSWDEERQSKNKNESGNNGPNTSGAGFYPLTGWRSQRHGEIRFGHFIVYRAGPPTSEARLRSLALSGVTLAETFDKGAPMYTATAATDATETTVTATPLDSDATTVIKLNDTVYADGTVDLKLGENTITVEVTAEDGTTIQTYTVTVTLEATVSFESGEYYVTEGDAVEVTMELSNALPRNATITFPLWTSDDSSMPDDYTLPESITFGANQTSASFTITTIQDTVAEPDELVLRNL